MTLNAVATFFVVHGFGRHTPEGHSATQHVSGLRYACHGHSEAIVAAGTNRRGQVHRGPCDIEAKLRRGARRRHQIINRKIGHHTCGDHNIFYRYDSDGRRIRTPVFTARVDGRKLCRATSRARQRIDRQAWRQFGNNILQISTNRDQMPS